uniref:Uncharacterized protein n=1 Tax=Glypta fumiferanae TaxID=389681 RepID=A0A0F6Q8V6_9HYME|nr:hypothetical protein [Glypta fumiferanae]
MLRAHDLLVRKVSFIDERHSKSEREREREREREGEKSMLHRKSRCICHDSQVDSRPILVLIVGLPPRIPESQSSDFDLTRTAAPGYILKSEKSKSRKSDRNKNMAAHPVSDRKCTTKVWSPYFAFPSQFPMD